MGGRQSQESSPSPVEVTHHAPSPSHIPTLSTPPPSHLSTLSEYPHLHPPPRSRTLGHPSNRLQPFEERRLSSLSRPTSRTSAEQLMDLDIALSTLQRRLQARGEAANRHRRHHSPHHHSPHHHSPHHSTLGNGIPLLLFRQIPTIQCPLCSKDILSSEMESHMVQCMTRPRVTYNADTLKQDAGECSICLDDMLIGEEIARLPCLCIYHLKCAQQWFKVSQTCPEHPDLT